MQSLMISESLFKTPEPRQFLRYCFNIDKLPLEEILEEETSFSYCTQCVRLLSKILGLQRKTVRSWGDNPNFEGMPQYARMTCNYAQLALSKEELNRIINQDFDAPKLTVMEFIEEILLKDLSSSEKLKVTTSSKFRSQCLTLLSDTFKVSKYTVYSWGSDLELLHMPKYYEHTLAYALTAYKKQEKTSKQSAA